ncbi:MAG: hypothetical protein CFE21_17355 [Bacteroidetes bacterium B1(2017)]|nr:MAG: hypothetical protein CFE21_17355 [Bacteroidetes bacterium B1(2017)]
MEFPRYHKDLVNDLMNGKFILASDQRFVSLKDNAAFFEKFFKESFGYALEVKSDYAFLLSYETAEQLSRDICIFFAILCYELDKDGKNFLEEIQYAEFEHEKIDAYFENSAYAELIASNNQLRSNESRRDFMRTLGRRNIVERTGDNKFTFTQAYKVFVDFAADFAKGKLSAPVSETDN